LNLSICPGKEKSKSGLTLVGKTTLGSKGRKAG
jgi:hypothetical protein